MPTPDTQPEKPPVSAPDVIRVPEINQPGFNDITTDCPIEMPVKEAI